MTTSVEASANPTDGIQGVAHVEIATDGPLGFVERVARIEGVDDEVVFGVSPSWRSHYGVGPDDFPPRATTNDIFVAALGSCLLAVYAGALHARGIELVKGDLTSRVAYDIGPVAGPGAEWIIRTIRVAYSLKLDGDKDRETAQRVLGFYETGCPLSQTLKGSRCTIETSVEFV
jgi:uncharacterized OsmC-like protein